MNELAPEGKIWQCQACGKMSKDLYGDLALHRGWDESCMLHAALIDMPPELRKLAGQVSKERAG